MRNLLKRYFSRWPSGFQAWGWHTEFKVTQGQGVSRSRVRQAGKEIVAWDVGRRPDMDQQKRLPAGAGLMLHSGMGWQYQHQWWMKELERFGIRQSMSRRGNCLDNAATEQVFGHLKDEFYRGRYERSNASWMRTSCTGTPDVARYESRDVLQRSSGARPS